ncbi:MAG: hypothetical protein J0H68_08350 [Sphingobacteriia bacterium]|nr:hypothetical protein [Sphingobacteriia bacterium]
MSSENNNANITIDEEKENNISEVSPEQVVLTTLLLASLQAQNNQKRKISTVDTKKVLLGNGINKSSSKREIHDKRNCSNNPNKQQSRGFRQ